MLNRKPLIAGLTALLAGALGLSMVVSPQATSGVGGVMPIAGTNCRPFPADNYWNTDISGLPVDSRSATWLSNMRHETKLHPDFGPSFGDGPNYGIPITVVGPKHRKVKVRFGYAAESDRVKYPLGRDTRIEGGRNSRGDKHAIIVDRGKCRLYETWNTTVRKKRWRAGSGATWSLNSNALRPDGWTSADAAGLPILPGLLRWNEVQAGSVNHAIRFTAQETSNHHLWPARHHAGSHESWAYPPMGARFRIKASFSEAGYSPRAQTILRAMKRYGMVLADNGTDWFFQGEQHAAWPIELIDELKRIPASAFEAVDTSSLRR